MATRTKPRKQQADARPRKSTEIVNRFVGVADCVAHSRNYQNHSEAQIADLRESLRLFRQVRSIVVQTHKHDERFTLVAGHGVWQAAQLEGFKRLRADVIPADWSETRVLAYLAADNELARHGDPDQAQLARIVADVAAAEGEALAKLAAGDANALRALLAGEKTESKEIQFDGNSALQCRVIVDCVSESQQRELLERFETEGLTCHALMS